MTTREALDRLKIKKLAGKSPIRYICINTDHASSQNPLESFPRIICGCDVSRIGPLRSSLGGEIDSKRSIGTIAQPGTLVNGKVNSNHNNITHTIITQEKDMHALSSDEDGSHKDAPSIESPFLPQCFFDAGPNDTLASPDDGFTLYPQSIDDECDSPALPPSFFDVGPYDFQEIVRNGFESRIETNNASADGSVLSTSLLDIAPYNAQAMSPN